WFATSGIIDTSDEVRDRMVRLTCSMSAATNSTRRSMEAGWLSKGTMTAKDALLILKAGLNSALRMGLSKAPKRASIGTAPWSGKGTDCRVIFEDRLGEGERQA